jgi:hypothetical protein
MDDRSAAYQLYVGIDVAADQAPAGYATLQRRLRAAGVPPASTLVVLEATGNYVRRFTARAIPPAGRTGSEGYLWANDSPGGESPRGQQHVVDAGQDRRRVGPGPARPVCYGESCTA